MDNVKTEILKKIDRIPPAICRLYARNGRRAPTCRELSKVTGIPKTKIAELSLAMSWEGEKIDTIEKFATACGVNLFRPSEVVEYFTRTKQAHLTAVKNPAQKKMLMKIWSFRRG